MTEDRERRPGAATPGGPTPGVVNDDGVVELRLGASVAAGGDGIGRLPDGRVVFIPGGLPGERITIEVGEERRDYARGRLLAVVEPSPGRVEPPCPWVARGCGGCGWQHAGLAAQLGMKEAVVVDSLRRLAHLDVTGLIEPAVPTPAAGYRTTVHLSVDPAGRAAYHRRGAAGLVEVEACGVAHPRLAELIDGVRVPGAERVTLRIGVAGGERLVIPGGASARRRGGGRQRSTGRRVPERRAGSVVAPPDAVVVGPGEDAVVHEDVGGRSWQVSARSFFQAGPVGAAALVEAVDAALGPMGPGDHLVDLYAGVGLLGGVVAARRGSLTLTAVESDPAGTQDARTNLADLDAAVVEVEVGAWDAVPAAAVIADPARPGLGRPGVGAVVATGSRRVVLVSCDPASLARDASLLAERGYRLGGVRLVDLFPQTPHVETVSWFERT